MLTITDFKRQVGREKGLKGTEIEGIKETEGMERTKKTDTYKEKIIYNQTALTPPPTVTH